MYIAAIIGGLTFGSTMKTADLLDEHGLKWFKGSPILFGFLWGIAGAALVSLDAGVASAVMATILCFLFRFRLDYRNHALAAGLIILAFILRDRFDLPALLSFLAVFSLAGFLRDAVDNRRSKDLIYWLSDLGWYNYAAPLAYGICSGDWLVFLAFSAYALSYSIVKHSAPDVIGR